MKLTVKICGDPVLRKVASPVEVFDSELRELAEAMIETMQAENGIGLAAPQVDVSKRLIVCLHMKGFDDYDAPPLVLVNPEVTRVSKETWSYEEGCLSVPGVNAHVTRPTEVDVKYQDLEGKNHTVTGQNLFGRILLHEIDHLDGILFIDYLSSAQKSLIKAKLKQFDQNRA